MGVSERQLQRDQGLLGRRSEFLDGSAHPLIGHLQGALVGFEMAHGQEHVAHFLNRRGVGPFQETRLHGGSGCGSCLQVGWKAVVTSAEMLELGRVRNLDQLHLSPRNAGLRDFTAGPERDSACLGIDANRAGVSENRVAFLRQE